jgi:hypothetical protein
MSENIIAIDSIILTPVKDGLTISMSPASCSISAGFDGRNQNLDRAFTDLELFLGSRQLVFSLSVVEVSDTRIQYTITDRNNGLTKRFRLTNVPTDILSGHVKFEFKTIYNEVTGGAVQFTVVRDVNTLDWIEDWENNKTKIGGDYLITPQLFVGRKVTSEDQLTSLTGVYIGPEGIAPNSSAGIYGYKEGKEIFHINETGGSIGGWDINNGGIQTSDGCLQILSEGSIFAKDNNNNVLWGIFKNGEAVFAKGNVKFFQDGSAYFQGKITSSEGRIGGWNITKNLLYSNYIVLDSSKHYIGVGPFDMSTLSSVPDTFKHYDKVLGSGGVAIHYTSANSYGVEGYLPGSKNTFRLGSTNFIAGWNFDNESLYFGTKNNTAKGYTNSSGSITLGTAGLRGFGWYIDTNGDISFMKGLMTFDSTTGTLLGWKMSSQRLSNAYVALISEATLAGLYLSSVDITNVASSSLESTIKSNSGIFLKRSTSRVELTGINAGNTIFSLTSTGDSSIAGWKFNNLAIYSGTYKSSGFTNSSSYITISTSGIRGYKWRLESDGSGALAGGNIQWDSNGIFTFGSTLSNSTKIDNGLVLSKNIFVSDSTGKVKAGMSAEGSGETGIRFFAGSANPALAQFRVDENGMLYSTNAHIEGTIKTSKGEIGGFEISSDRIGAEASQSGDGGYLAIYNNFFRVGGSDGYVMFGNNVIPATTGGAFTATGRIVNDKVNQYASYGFDTANYGLFIDVTGGTKNYGISSNAPLKAPGFINTGIKELNFTGSSYSIDFSQSNIFLVYASQQYSITMPAESSVAKMFSLPSLPENFGFVVIWKMRTGSAKITLQGIYNQNETSANFDLSAGDSIMLLVTKKDGFRYNVLNYNT